MGNLNEEMKRLSKESVIKLINTEIEMLREMNYTTRDGVNRAYDILRGKVFAYYTVNYLNAEEFENYIQIINDEKEESGVR